MHYHNENYDFLVIGAGIAGITLAKHFKNKKILILEKSKGLGGRLATRRVGSFFFDHGIQYLPSEIKKNQHVLSTLGKLNVKIDQKQNIYFEKGMTVLPKLLSENLNILLNTKIVNICRSNSGWLLSAEDDKKFLANNIIITSPLPQSLDLLSNSNISYSKSLDQIKYSKAIIYLINGPKYVNSQNAINEFEIFDQKIKNLSAENIYTVVMNKYWSELNYEKKDEELIELGKINLSRYFSELELPNISLKKWKFSRCEKSINEKYIEIENGVYLIGDAFAGGDILGSIASAEYLAKHFQSL